MRDSSRLSESVEAPSNAAGHSKPQAVEGVITRSHGTQGVSTLEHDDSGERPSPGDLVGRTIGKYEIVGLVGRGGMGCVYEAINTAIQKRVAMKVIDQELAKNDEATARFQREALAASAIESPQIVQIFDAGFTDGGTPFIVMELLRGRDLGDLLKERQRLSPDEVLPIVGQILKGLHYAHEAGIVHRDLKPDNVFLCERDDEPIRAKLLDFGVSKIARTGSDVPLQTLTRQGTVVGTPYYMSPEQAQAFPDVDGRTDIYSVGAILYECLAGRPPHVGKSYEQVIVNICMKDVDPIDEQNLAVGPELASIVHRALSKEREDRYASARDFLQALAEIAPDSVRISSPSGSLRRVGASSGSGSDRVVATPPSNLAAAKRSEELAATLHADDSISHATIDRDEMAEALRRSGQSEKLRQSGTQAVSTMRTPAMPIPGALKKRTWMLALVLGVALVVGVMLLIRFTGIDAEGGAVSPAAARAPLDPDPVGANDIEKVAEKKAAPKATASPTSPTTSEPPAATDDPPPVSPQPRPRVPRPVSPRKAPPAPKTPPPPVDLVNPDKTPKVETKPPELKLQVQ